MTMDLLSACVTYHDMVSTVNHFMPQFDTIIDYLYLSQKVRTREHWCDIEFVTSFLCAYLYCIMPRHLPYLHMIRVRDLYLNGETTPQPTGHTPLPTQTQYVGRSSTSLPSPVIASASISELQKTMAMDEATAAVIYSYVNFIRPRISKFNDYLLMNSSGLGLTAADVEERVRTLVYRVTGKVGF